MDKASRPARWAAAINRATDAKWELQTLREQLITARDELEDQWSTARKEFDAALSELINLQSSYAHWEVPANLTQSRTQEKLDYVGSLDFQILQEKVPDLNIYFLSWKNSIQKTMSTSWF